MHFKYKDTYRVKVKSRKRYMMQTLIIKKVIFLY